ncbi:MAG: hypothetical protein ACJ761_08405 [Chloroflexota bacterium]
MPDDERDASAPDRSSGREADSSDPQAATPAPTAGDSAGIEDTAAFTTGVEDTAPFATGLPTAPATPPPATSANRASAWEAGRAQRRDPATGSRDRRSDGRGGAFLVGIILILIGAWFLLERVFPSIDMGVAWPILAVAGGLLLIVLSIRPGRADR